MKRKPTYGQLKSTSQTGEGSPDGLYNGLSIDPDDVRELRLIDPLIDELLLRRESILSKYDPKADIPSFRPASIPCFVIRPDKFNEGQVVRFIEFLYYEEIFKELTKLRLAIEILYPRFSDEPKFIRTEPIKSNVPTATLVRIFDFLSDRYAIENNLTEILPQHFLSDTGDSLNAGTIKKNTGGERKEQYSLDPFLKAKLEAIFS